MGADASEAELGEASGGDDGDVAPSARASQAAKAAPGQDGRKDRPRKGRNPHGAAGQHVGTREIPACRSLASGALPSSAPPRRSLAISMTSSTLLFDRH